MIEIKTRKLNFQGWLSTEKLVDFFDVELFGNVHTYL